MTRAMVRGVIDAVSVEGDDGAGDVLADHAAERACIAAVMLDDTNAVWRRLSPLLVAAHFHDPRHAAVWSALATLHARGEVVDVLTVAAELKARGALARCGGPQFLGELTDAIPTLAHCETHARLVVAASVRRELGTIGVRLAAAAADAARDPVHLRDLAVEALRRVRVAAAAAPSSMDDLLTEFWADTEAAVQGRASGPLPFHVPTLDRLSEGGMKRGGAYFLAARPGIGKTTLACQIAGAVAEQNERALYVALEPAKGDVVRSMLASRAGVSLLKLTRQQLALSQDEMNRLANVSNASAAWPLHAIDASGRDAPDTVAGIEAAMHALPSMPALVIVDHLLKVSPVGHHDKPHNGTAQVVAGLVALGKRTGATFLVLAHIGRGVSTNGNLFRRPRVEDIAGGDSINRDADGILMLHREDKYPTRKESLGDPLLNGVVDVLAPKLRGVADNGYARLRFRGDVQRFDEYEGAPFVGDDA